MGVLSKSGVVASLPSGAGVGVDADSRSAVGADHGPGEHSSVGVGAGVGVGVGVGAKRGTGTGIGARFGIRARMVLIALAIGLPFLVYVGFSTVQQASVEAAHARSQLRLVAGLTGARLDDRINDVRQLLKALNGSLDGDIGDRARNDSLLRKVKPEFPPEVLAVSLWNLEGKRVGESDVDPPPDGALMTNAADRPFFQQALQQRTFVTEAPLHDEAHSRWIAVFAMPITQQGRVIGVVSASSSLLSMKGVLDPGHDLPPGAVIAVMDAEGRIVARSVDADKWIGKSPVVEPELRKRRFVEGSGSMEVVGIDGVMRIYAYARARSAPWLVNVGLPLEQALRPVHDRVVSSLLQGGALLVLGLIVAAVFAERLARPIRQLSVDAATLAAGDLSHRSSVRTTGEIGVLADTLNHMATALQERQHALGESEVRLNLALEGSELGLFDWNLATGLMYLSAQVSVMRGGPAVEMDTPPAAIEHLVHPDDLAGLKLRVKDAVSGRTPALNAEFRVRTEGARINATGYIWVRRRGRVVERDARGRAVRLAGTVADVTTRKKNEDELRQRAEIDALTGLPNRALFNERIRRAMARGQRYNRPMALLFVDVDHFKQINDTLGHEAGDALLRAVARRMADAVRGADTVARLAGDEFVVILEQLNSVDDAIAVAQKLVDAVRIPVAIGRGQRVPTSISVGVAMALPGESDGAAWLHRADEALYEAKRRGRDRYAVDTRTSLAERRSTG